MIDTSTVSPSISHERIIRDICAEIRSGKIQPGEKMRIREDIIRDFRTTPTTVQRAFTRLARDGFIVPRGRSGTFVAERPPNLRRVGLVFFGSKALVLQRKHWLALSVAAAEYDEQAEKTLATYYGVGPGEPGDGRRRLLDDARNDRLAGLLWTYVGSSLDDTDELIAQCGLPSVGLTATPRADLSTVHMMGFQDRAMAELARLGGRKVAVFMLSTHRDQVEKYLSAAQRHGLEGHACWCVGVDAVDPEWVQSSLELLLNLPAAQRPDSLVVGDDNLNDATISAMIRLRAVERLKTVFHTNFPVLSKPTIDMPMVGYDCRHEIRAALEVLDCLCERKRNGLPSAVYRVTLSARSESETESPVRVAMAGD